MLHNEPLVHMVCNKYLMRAKRNGADYEDLLQAGMMALYRAVLSYDETLGYKFSTLAIIAITREVARCVERQCGHPENTHINTYAFRLDAPAPGTDDLDWFDLIYQDRDNDETVVYVADFLRQLPERDRIIITLRMQGSLHREIGQYVGISGSRVQQRIRAIKGYYECYLHTGRIR